MRVPHHIQQVLDQQKQPNERWKLGPYMIEIDEKRYYVCDFYPTRNGLIIDEHGAIPYFDEVKKVVDYGMRFEGYKQEVFRPYKRNSGKLTIFHNTIVRNVLRKFIASLDVSSFKKEIYEYYQGAQLVIDTELEKKRVITEGCDIIKKAMSVELITDHMIDHLNELRKTYFNQYIISNRKIFNAKRERTIVIKSLLSKIPFYRLDLWGQYLILLYYYIVGQNYIDDDDMRATKTLERRVIMGQLSEGGKQIRDVEYNKIRNPKNI
ncbi:hypothetical protein IC620_08645 [Hazenella sp. IB182357]|uniref:Uncharacterized protein n=1 Tax=Polycladospora coralii TaxID=2771432 RepID=A0A926NBQ8_9BACL|nr:hypothetical protein [Polycladospora coralii]MBD1372425.1 hypothetical protein [Polycladospora coralii]